MVLLVSAASSLVMFSSPLFTLFWSLYTLLFAVTGILAAHWLHRAGRSGATVLMLVGAWAGGILSVGSRAGWVLSSFLGWDLWTGVKETSLMVVLQSMSMAASLGNLALFVGLLWYARKRLGEKNRIAELEAILQDQGMQGGSPPGISR